MSDTSIINFIRNKLELLNDNSKLKKYNIDLDLCSFILYKIYFEIFLEYNKDINEEEITKTVTSILKNGLFN